MTFLIKTYTTGVHNSEDCFTNQIDLLDKLESDGVLLFAENRNKRDYGTVFSCVDESIEKTVGEYDFHWSIEIDQGKINLYEDYFPEYDDEDGIDEDKMEKEIFDTLHHYTVSTRGYSQSDWDEYDFVTNRELTDEEKATLDVLKHTFTVTDFVVSLVESKYCDCCNATGEETIDSITTTLYEYKSDEEILELTKEIAKDHFDNYDDIDWNESEISQDYEG